MSGGDWKAYRYGPLRYDVGIARRRLGGLLSTAHAIPAWSSSF